MSTPGDDNQDEKKEQEEKIVAEETGRDFEAAQARFLAETNARLDQIAEPKKTTLSIGSENIPEPTPGVPRAKMPVGMQKEQNVEPESLQFQAEGQAQQPASTDKVKKTIGVRDQRPKMDIKGEISWKRLFEEIGELLKMLTEEFPQLGRVWYRGREQKIKDQLTAIADACPEGIEASQALINDLQERVDDDPEASEDPAIQAQLFKSQYALDDAEVSLSPSLQQSRDLEDLEWEFEDARQVASNVDASPAQGSVLTASQTARAAEPGKLAPTPTPKPGVTTESAPEAETPSPGKDHRKKI